MSRWISFGTMDKLSKYQAKVIGNELKELLEKYNFDPRMILPEVGEIKVGKGFKLTLPLLKWGDSCF